MSQEGGAKKSTSKKPTSQKKVASVPKKTAPKSKSVPKKGGAIMQDVKNLAVPFAILLAKEGLTKMFPKDSKKSTNTSVSPSSASKPSSSRRRSTMSGGSCNMGCGMTGGAAAKQLFQLQKDIDMFLEKY